MPPEIPPHVEDPTNAWVAHESVLLERARRLARNERLGQALHDAVLTTTRRIVDGTPT